MLPSNLEARGYLSPKCRVSGTMCAGDPPAPWYVRRPRTRYRSGRVTQSPPDGDPVVVHEGTATTGNARIPHRTARIHSAKITTPFS